MEGKSLFVDGEDGGKTALLQFGGLFYGTANGNDGDVLMGGGFQYSHGGFAHQCLTVDAAFARYYKVATCEKFFEMEGIEH